MDIVKPLTTKCFKKFYRQCLGMPLGVREIVNRVIVYFSELGCSFRGLRVQQYHSFVLPPLTNRIGLSPNLSHQLADRYITLTKVHSDGLGLEDIDPYYRQRGRAHKTLFVLREILLTRDLKGPLIRKGCEFSHEILSLVRTHQISLDVRLPLVGAEGLLKGTTPSGDQIKLFSFDRESQSCKYNPKSRS